MGTRFRRVYAIAGLVLAGGVLLAGPGTSCTSFIARTAVTAVDAGFIFDCQAAAGGIFSFEGILADCTQGEGP